VLPLLAWSAAGCFFGTMSVDWAANRIANNASANLLPQNPGAAAAPDSAEFNTTNNFGSSCSSRLLKLENNYATMHSRPGAVARWPIRAAMC
jgi:hypothetical protein